LITNIAEQFDSKTHALRTCVGQRCIGNFIGTEDLLGIFQACPWEWDSYGNPMGNVPWDRTGITCYGNGTDKYVPWTNLGLSIGMSILWESHGKRPVGWDRTGQA